MESLTIDGPSLIVIAVAVLLVLALLAWWLAKWRKSHALKKDFGPEYKHEVKAAGSRTEAEAELRARKERVAAYDLHELHPEDRERFAARWREVQKRFVDHPSDAVQEAAVLIDEAMEHRGYPLGQIRDKEADLSVHYPKEVQDYRKAYAIADRNRRGEASTEDLREATLCYRGLFDHLVGLDESHHQHTTETAS